MSEKVCQDVFAGYVCECFGEDCEVAMNEALAEAQKRYEAGIAGEDENSYNNYFNLVQKAEKSEEAEDSSVSEDASTDAPVVDDSSVNDDVVVEDPVDSSTEEETVDSSVVE